MVGKPDLASEMPEVMRRFTETKVMITNFKFKSQNIEQFISLSSYQISHDPGFTFEKSEN